MVEIPPNVRRLRQLLTPCRMCPRRCGADRAAGQRGTCRIGAEAVVASAGPHFGEEPPLVGTGGSGTIFFSGCNLDCVFCQNADISHSAEGCEMPPGRIASLMLGLEARRCENINFVTPTHVSHAVAEAILAARAAGLGVPVVYNCGGYESVETLRLLEGLVDIYMPDFKYADAEAALRYSGAADYPAAAAAALEEMYRQVGPLVTDDRGRAVRGVLVRHLVLPGDVAAGRAVVETVARSAPGCALNIMAQYRPCFRAAQFEELTARPGAEEVDQLRQLATSLGLERPE